MGYMLDLLWAQAFGHMAPPLQKELGFSDTEMGNIFTSFSAGLCFHFIVVYVLNLGRRWAFNLTVLITSVFGLAIGAPSNYNRVIVLTSFIGLGIGGNLPIDTTITLEFLPHNKRYLPPAFSVGQPIGVVICSAIAYGFIPTTLALFRFLSSKGQDEEAIQVLHKVAEMNGTICTLTVEDLRDEDTRGDGETQGFSSLKLLAHIYNFSELNAFLTHRKNLRLVTLTWLTYAFDAWGFTIAGSFLPTILLRKNETINVSLEDTYKSYIIIYICGIPATLLATGIVEVPRVGRKWGMVISSALMTTSLFLFTNIGLNAMEYFFQSLFNAILYGWTPEAFPAPIRGSACGIASFWGRLFSIIAPSIGARLLEVGGAGGINNVLYLAGAAGVFVCTIATALLPPDTGNKNKQTI
ncbi:putative MFS-type transporter PB1E7,08c [Schizosaccharomyces pombe 972h-] [Rhizoctonia solani]|uniref:Putative MFS-type transporter PB1E7,08c [Schizosaccharomyces pombe 972h-] n=1 Tax=Rhizoctonia solani TaxID=456999 RepID=A0A0K6GI51_9AGAM|nr:putative MFS-type transporter PB1E7,08c [Schizosaccharomyces pombe 972h-] [Rhizoctonia solani]